MTQRREFDLHRRKLGEIRDIMHSMKTLAYLETHKLARFIDTQHRLVTDIEEIASDFLCFNPQVLPDLEPTTDIVVLLGSERGFCGDFNEVLLKHLQLTLTYHAKHSTTLVAVGQKLQPLLETPPYPTVFIDGANATEEIGNILGNLVKTLASHQKPPLSLYVLHHGGPDNGVVSQRLLPPFQHINREAVNFSNPPYMNLSPQAFLLELTDQYLFAALHRALIVSLMAENQSRIQHLGNAERHLDGKMSELTRKSNALRQEEIIEEIEVILLNSSNI